MEVMGSVPFLATPLQHPSLPSPLISLHCNVIYSRYGLTL